MAENTEFLAPTVLTSIDIQPMGSIITESSSDKETTEDDLVHLNNQLAFHHASLPGIRTIQGLCATSAAVCRLIETRRKVKKLQFGAPSEKGGGKVFEVIE